MFVAEPARQPAKQPAALTRGVLAASFRVMMCGPMLLQVPAWTKDASAPPAPGNTASSAVNRRKQATVIAQVRCRNVLPCMHPEKMHGVPAGSRCHACFLVVNLYAGDVYMHV
jgi:hypothetical protein